MLILDEATSALDEKTEQKLMWALNTLNQELTEVMVEHRLSTLNKTEKIIDLSGYLNCF